MVHVSSLLLVEGKEGTFQKQLPKKTSYACNVLICTSNSHITICYHQIGFFIFHFNDFLGRLFKSRMHLFFQLDGFVESSVIGSTSAQTCSTTDSRHIVFLTRRGVTSTLPSLHGMHTLVDRNRCWGLLIFFQKF